MDGENIDSDIDEGDISSTAGATTSQTESDTALGNNEGTQVITSNVLDIQDMKDKQDMESAEALPMKGFEGSISASENAKKAAFTGLVPGEAYVILVVKNPEAFNLLSASNLLYITQGNADDTGNLSIEYVPRTSNEAEAQAYGMSNQNLTEAEITVSDLNCTGKPQAPKVTVIYKGVTLEEERDYTVSGDTMVTDIGNYSITITGKNDYAGSVTKSFKVTAGRGDINKDGTVNLLDLMACLNHVARKITLTGEEFQLADVDGNGTINLLDLMRILNYVAKKTATV